MRDQQSGSTPPAEKCTWVVLCPGADGRPRSEYVEGTDLVTDDAAGALLILDGGRVVREYTAGAWSTFCEWVNAYSDFLHGTVIRLAAVPEPRPATEAERVLAGVMAMDTEAALGMLSHSLSRGRMSSGSDGAVRTPARLPGPRHA